MQDTVENSPRLVLLLSCRNTNLEFQVRVLPAAQRHVVKAKLAFIANRKGKHERLPITSALRSLR